LVAATDLEPGDQLLAARLAAKQLVSEEVTDKVQISALLEAERAAGGSLEKGDLVGVYLSFDPFELDEAGEQTADGADPAAAAVMADEASGDDESAAAEPGTDEAVDGPTKTPNVSRLEFQHVLVTNVQTINAPVNPEDTDVDTGVAQVTSTQYVVTLALSPEQSERFVFGTEFGHVWLSIEPATVDDDGTRPVTLGNVYTVVR
jgi:pilus assembly protein CpaB